MRLTDAYRIALIAMLAAGCAAPPPPVPVHAEPADISKLHGEWKGEYESPALGRAGSIVFRLEAGSDTAYGDVVMVPRDGDEPVRPEPAAELSGRGDTSPEVLRIAFVRLAGGQISGRLEPYRDPECGCAVYTTFTGYLEDGVIRGQFVSLRGRAGGAFEGTWRAKRIRP